MYSRRCTTHHKNNYINYGDLKFEQNKRQHEIVCKLIINYWYDDYVNVQDITCVGGSTYV